MLRLLLWLTCLCFPLKILAFNFSSVSGLVIEDRGRKPLSGVRVCLGTCEIEVRSDASGIFLLSDVNPGTYDLTLSLSGYRPLSLPVVLTPNKRLELGVIAMERIAGAQDELDGVEDMVSRFPTEESLLTDFMPLNALGATFERRAAFNFSQAFYRSRGYDSRYREVLLNGMPVNELSNGRAPFALWGGLNDVFRNREFVSGMGAVPAGFGDVGGSLHFLLDPAMNRRGLRVSSSASNRGYGGRFMATYSSGELPGRWAYSISSSRRWAEEGYVDGTLYDAVSFFASARYRLTDKDALVFNALYAPQRRGVRPALTREVAELAGHRYNPYWGYDRGKVRNSRVRRSRKPFFLLNYMHRSTGVDWNVGFSYTTGYRSYSRLGYYDAPNPDPVYYRYLPSAELNGGVVSFENARMARENFLTDPQVDWEELYRINQQGGLPGRAFYALYDDRESGHAFGLAANLLIRTGRGGELSAGFHGRRESTAYYAYMRDLLGAEFHLDRDPYSITANQLDGPGQIREGDAFQYHYLLHANHSRAFIRYTRRFRKVQAFAAIGGAYLRTVREGLFRNERYADHSAGKGGPVERYGGSLKVGGEYRLSGRHMFSVGGFAMTRLPDLNTIYVNPREHHSVVNNLQPEQLTGGEIGYRMDLPDLRLRTTLYYTAFSDRSKVSYYYLDGGVGSAFVQETLSGIATTHLGGELSLDYDLSPEVRADLVVGYGVHRYAADPRLAINFNTVNEDRVIAPEGTFDLGAAQMEGLYVSSGPQSAVALGVEYRSPGYWWIGAVASYLDRNFIGVSGVRRTESFFTDPETGEAFAETDMDVARALLRQEQLQPLYYLDLTAGKSWLFKSVYVSLFLSVNNLFNAVYETGGYEQNRTANYRDLYEDSLSGSPSFGNKYWYGSGRTFFINLAVNL